MIKKKEEGNLPFGLTFAINYSSTQWTSKEPYKVWHGSYFTWNIGMVEITLSQREPISSSWNRRVSIYQFANVLINISFIMVYNSNNSKLSKLITTILTLGLALWLVVHSHVRWFILMFTCWMMIWSGKRCLQCQKQTHILNLLGRL